jgi:hypothetical protein
VTTATRLTLNLLCVVAASLCWAAPSAALIPLLEWGEDDEGRRAEWSLSGQLRDMLAVQKIPYDTGGLLSETNGINASVARLQWRLALWDTVVLDLQQRLYWQLTAEPLVVGGGLGVGATRSTQRTVDLRSDWIQTPTHTLRHDLDRLSISIQSEDLDLTLGRQSITWGRSNLFVVSDIWTQFSPFELDTSQKPGIDGARALTSWADGAAELEAVVIDRGRWQDLSGGLRLNTYLDWGDVSAAVAWERQRLMLLADLSWALDGATARLDASWVVTNTDGAAPRAPRVTVGYDYIALSDWLLSAEYHFNGWGASDPDDYLEVARSEESQRGELYWLGMHYAGLIASWSATELLSLTFAAIGNLTDPSVNLIPSALYRLSDATEISLGAYVGLGRYPSLTDAAGAPLLAPTLRSEFGNQGSLIYVQMASYF